MSRLRANCPEHPRWDPDAVYDRSGIANPFKRATGRNISFADVDSETEIGGNWLVIEFKREGQELPLGQRLTNEARLRDGRHVLIVWGQPSYLVTSMAWFPAEPQPADFDDFDRAVTRWAVWATSNPKSAAA